MKGLLFSGVLLAAMLADARVGAESSERKAARPSQPIKETPVRLADVDPSNGIDADEARAIAEAYFEREYGDCGGPDDVKRRGRTWVFGVLFGLTGAKLKETIAVDAKTGGVWSAGKPRYQTFEAFRDENDRHQRKP